MDRVKQDKGLSQLSQAEREASTTIYAAMRNYQGSVLRIESAL
jgi:hypothetical protein